LIPLSARPRLSSPNARPDSQAGPDRVARAPPSRTRRRCPCGVAFTGTGTITSGELTGATATFIWVCTVPNPLLCLTTGVTSQSGTLAATILSAA
jgi:hypothetical protein